MSDDLYKSVGAARDTLDAQQDAASRPTAAKSRIPQLVIYAVLFAVAILVNVVLAIESSRENIAEYRSTTLSLLKLANDEITDYYRANGSLPSQLEDPETQFFLQYRAINATEFELTMTEGPFTTPLRRSVTTPLRDSDLAVLFD